MSILQAMVIGLIQGFTELFPISSLGHSVIIPQILGWHIHQNDAYFLTFLVATHLATAIVLFLFFLEDWIQICKGIVRSLLARRLPADDIHARLGWLLIVATIPAGIIGIVLEHPLRQLFASAQIAAAFLIVNGLILMSAERLRKHANSRRVRGQRDSKIARLSWLQALGIGIAQAGALIPGISRSGVSMAAGLRVGLNNEDAARFSFLLATPVIGAAALLKLPDLFHPAAASLRGAVCVGAICAALSAFVSVRFLVKYFKTQTLIPFARYCLIAGVLYSAILLFR